MRIAVVSTPRSGNMWLRRLLAFLYGLEERSAHTPDEVDWERLPGRTILQLHWRRTPRFTELLERFGFTTVVLARHPLDTLLSILHFAAHEPETARWLDGRAGDERLLVGADPTSAAFVDYSTSERARVLVDVSVDWWAAPVLARVRYEDLVARPESELARIVEAAGEATAAPITHAIRAVTFARLQAEAGNHHFWRGTPGHWRSLIPAGPARSIGEAHRPALRRFGYGLDPDPELKEAVARARWTGLAIPAGPG
ncbi:MAG: sulfotransferase [Gaiellaceae bacterium]